MIFCVTPIQIPLAWESIKFAAFQSDNVIKEKRQEYSNNLLIDLLSGSRQALVRLNDENLIDAVMLTKIERSDLTGERTLFFTNFFSWKSTEIKEWEEAFQIVMEFAKKNECKHFEAYSYNPAVWSLADRVGFKETGRHYYFKI